jgi:hypothetical protein
MNYLQIVQVLVRIPLALASKHRNDRDAYTDAKTDFIRFVLDQK